MAGLEGAWREALKEITEGDTDMFPVARALETDCNKLMAAGLHEALAGIEELVRVFDAREYNTRDRSLVVEQEDSFMCMGNRNALWWCEIRCASDVRILTHVTLSRLKKRVAGRDARPAVTQLQQRNTTA